MGEFEDLALAARMRVDDDMADQSAVNQQKNSGRIK